MAITISDISPRIQYTATAGQTSFTVPFEFFDDDDLVVVNTNSGGVDTTLTKAASPSTVTQYSVTGAGVTGGGSITLGAGATLNDTYTITRNVPIARSTDFATTGVFPIDSLNTELDKIVAMMQQQGVDINLSPRAASTTSTAYGLIFPELTANKVLSVNSNGDGLIFTQEIGNYKGNWAASTAYVQRDLVKDTSNGNIYIVNTAHTSSGSQPLSTNTNSSYYDLIVDAETASTYASNAATSATAAASSATSAATSATAAQTAQTAAELAETNAETAQTAAETAQTGAETAETNAGTSATAAASSATSASTQATNAATSATAAATSATNASTSESNAATSATSAAGSATTATTQASAASTSATNAATSETNAATSASNASTSETNAANSATSAATSATNASTSATNASNSASAAAASAASAANSYDQFDDRYLGTKTSDPTLDNDGNALVAGALYFNSSANEMRVYDGGNWIPASSAGTASLIIYEYTATSGQTTFSGTDDNAATLSYSVNNLFVTLNGVVLDPDDYTATSGTSIVLGTGATTGDLLTVHAFKSFTVSELNANNLTDGTIPDARFPAVLPAVDGSNLTGITSVGGATGVDFNDNVKARFGTGNDLEIYHDGSNSYISDVGTGNLNIRGTNLVLEDSSGNDYIVCTDLGTGGNVSLKYGAVEKLATTANGVDVSGNLLNFVTPSVDQNARIDLLEQDGASALGGFVNYNGANNRLEIGTVLNGTDTTHLTLPRDGSGDVGIGVSPTFTAGGSRKLLQVTNGSNGGQISLSNNSNESNNPRVFGNSADLGFATGASGNGVIQFYTNSTERFRIDSNGHVIPQATNTYDLGSSSNVWRNIYTSDFHMSNEGLDKGNDIDGTKGSWTFQEGEENLYLINNKNGKKYKFNLTEIE